MTRFYAATAAIALCTSPALAQEDLFQLDEIVFSAGLTALEASRTGVTVEVIDEEELAEAGDIQLSDYLATLPGITVAQSGPPGTISTVRIRGLSGDYIPVLVNGINITDPSTGQSSLNFGTLTVGGISRVEVLYGSQGALFGSEAIAGVINITTVEAPDELGTETTLALEAGTYNTVYGSVGVGTRFDRGTLTFSLSRTDTDGFSAAEENDGNTEDDGFTDTTLTFGTTYDVTDQLTVGLSVFYQDSTTEIDAGAGPGQDDPDRFVDSERRAARVFAQFDGQFIDHEISYAYSETDRFDSGFGGSMFNGQRTEIRYLGTTDVGADGVLSFGLERSEEEAVTSFSSGEIDSTAAFLDYNTALSGNLDLSASLRYDDHSIFGGQATGRLALAWRPDDATVVRASLGTGFRAPSLSELFSVNGNPDLEPEESLSFELGAERDFGRGTLRATLFYTEIDNVIDFVRGSTVCASTFGCFEQIEGTTVSQGVEIAGSYDINDRWTLFGNYTYTDARTEGARLARVPRHYAVLGLSGEVTDRIGLDLRAQGSWDQEVSEFAPNPFEDYVVVDASVSYAINDDTEAYFRIDNLFDEEYQTAPGFGTSDRAFYLGLRAQF